MSFSFASILASLRTTKAPNDELREAIQWSCAAGPGLDCFVASLLAMTSLFIMAR